MTPWIISKHSSLFTHDLSQISALWEALPDYDDKKAIKGYWDQSKSMNSSWLADIFRGQYLNITTWTDCNHNSYTANTFTDIVLELPWEINLVFINDFS